IKSAREAVTNGKLGQLTAVVGLWLLRKPDDYFEVAWRREAGGGPLLINLIHDIDNLRFICGEIVEVQALTSNKVRGFAVEDTAALLLRFANGALGTVTVSDATPAPWSWELSSGENPAYPRQDQPCY
ncbi:gfo/Idh/MocA family oxidoreductase, partial [Bradyrhizobium sp. BRP14]|nr:gfo/Idh/MocA family oxidoreductase [Bradyrhizobium sp. BRP14]